MTSPFRFFSTSVGTKVLIALTGLGFAAFLLLHLAANLLVLVDYDAYNAYSHKLVSNPLVYTAEAGLAALFLIHAYVAIANYLRNRRARPLGYEQQRWSGHTSRKSLASTTMILSGIWLLAFMVLHLKTFKFGAWYPGPHGMRDLARLVIEKFAEPGYVLFYVVSMAVVGLHLRHGLSSAFQSLGVDHPRYLRWILRAGLVVAVLIGVGFAAIPVVLYLHGGRP
jgi:succinate dehydrogenase / fumarate reductase cytochrome b subunit